jgi:hypothetical protein
MAKKKVKLKAQKVALELHPPKIVIQNNLEPFTAKELRVHFAGEIINGLVSKFGDLGGRQDKALAVSAFKLADVMVETYYGQN